MPLLVAAVLASSLHVALWFGLRPGPPAAAEPGAVHMIVRVVDLEPEPSNPASIAQPPVAEPKAAAASPAEQTAVAPPAASPSALEQHAKAGGDEYIDSRRLSVRPAPIGEFTLPPLRMGSRVGPAKAVLTLFIDETGHVVRVRVESSNLPANADNEAQQAFADARFQPGMLDGRAVKSRLRVEVLVEPAPMPGEPGSASPRPASSAPGS